MGMVATMAQKQACLNGLNKQQLQMLKAEVRVLEHSADVLASWLEIKKLGSFSMQLGTILLHERAEELSVL